MSLKFQILVLFNVNNIFIKRKKIKFYIKYFFNYIINNIYIYNQYLLINLNKMK